MIAPYINAIYSIFSYGLNRYIHLPSGPPLPPAISIELTSLCNLSCPECVTGSGMLTRRKGFIDLTLAEKIAAELSENTLSAYLYFQGEPMMHPHFFDIVKLFRKMHPVISTNGHFLDRENCNLLAQSGLKKIIIPYDGVTPETYNIYLRGGDHARVTGGIQLLSEILKKDRSSMDVELQFLIGRHNEHEVREAARFARSVNAGFRIKSMQVLDIKRAGKWMPSQSKKSRYVIANDNCQIDHTTERGCLRMWTTAVITVDGDVVPCCFDKNANNVMGNLKDQTFREIWYGNKYRAFRNSVMKSRSSVDICSVCSQGRRLLFSH